MIFERQYRTQQGYECLGGCICNLLQYGGCQLNESDILLNGNGFRFYYSGDIYENAFGYQVYEANEQFLKKWKIPYRHIWIETEKMENFLSEQIEREKGVILRVNSKYLPYDPVFKTMASVPHAINVIGEKVDNYIISDSAIPSMNQTYFQGAVNKKEVLTAWQQMGGESFLIDVTKLPDCSKIQESSREILKDALLQYCSFKKKFWRHDYEGTAAIQKLYEDLYTEALRGADMKALAMDLNYYFKLNGFITCRQMILIKLEELEIANVYLALYKEIIDEWNRLLYRQIRAGILNRAEEFGKIMKQALELNKKEEKLYRRLDWI